MNLFTVTKDLNKFKDIYPITNPNKEFSYIYHQDEYYIFFRDKFEV